MNVRLLVSLAGCVLLAPLFAFSSENATQEGDRLRFEAVVRFADLALRDAADRWQHTPLLANGIDLETKDQLRWRFPSGQEAVISDLSVQQNFFRLLTGLSNLTGDARYKAAAKECLAYHFDKLQDPSGLLQWGGHRFVDLRTTCYVGPSEKEQVHELKNAFPYYELMYETNPSATVRFIEGFWNAHVYDWSTLEISRHGSYGKTRGELWKSRFDDPPPFIKTKGLSFLDAGNDLIYSAAMLCKLTGDESALRWAKLLASRYVKARNAKTGLGAYQYTQPERTRTPTNDADTFSWYGDRASRQFGPEYGDRALEGTMLLRGHATTLYSENALMQLELVQTLGAPGRDFLDWTQSGLLAFVRQAYDPASRKLKPMLTDGTDLSNVSLARDGYYGKKGTLLTPYAPSEDFLLSYARAYLITGDRELWSFARAVAQNLDLGDLGEAPGPGAKPNLNTKNNGARALFALLDLYERTKENAYLELARRLGDNIVRTKMKAGYFVLSQKQDYANIDAVEPYALLALEAAIRGQPGKVPLFINGAGFIGGEYKFADGTIRSINDELLYRTPKNRL